jgi:hypothetical protein
VTQEDTCGRCKHFEAIMGGFCKLRVLLGDTGETREDTPACRDYEEKV